MTRISLNLQQLTVHLDKKHGMINDILKGQSGKMAWVTLTGIEMINQMSRMRELSYSISNTI